MNRILSKREHRVIQLVAEGLRNREVAQEIGTTENVVKKYLCVIYDKLGLWNRVELALWYESRRSPSVLTNQGKKSESDIRSLTGMVQQT